MIISKAELEPKYGYVEDIDNDGNHYLKKIETPVGYKDEEIVITTSQPVKLSKAKDNKYNVILVSGGNGIDSVTGVSTCGTIEESELEIDEDIEVFVTIGSAGTTDTNGGTTSFGSYFCAMSSNDNNSTGLTIGGYVYGRGQTPDNEATDGVCIIKYQTPVYM